MNKFKIKITPKEIAELLECDVSTVSKQKTDGIIVSDDGIYNTYDTVKRLLKHYRGKSGDIDLKSEKIVSEIKINEEQVEILKIKKERLRGSLVEFDLIKLAFDEMSIVIRNAVLDSDAELCRLARTSENIDTARIVVRKKLTDCLKKLSDLNAENFDCVTKEEIEDSKEVPLEKVNDA